MDPSDVVAQHQLARMRLQIDLTFEVGDVVDADVMADERDRHDERHEPASVLVDARGELLSRIRIYELLEVTGHVREHVGVPPHGRRL